MSSRQQRGYTGSTKRRTAGPRSFATGLRLAGPVSLLAFVLQAVPVAAAAGPAEVSAGRPPGIYWIYWTPAWETPAAPGERTVSARAEARMRRAGASRAQADPADVPVPRLFLEHLHGLGIEVRTSSRFLRAVSADLDREDLLRLKADPGVRALVPVGRRTRRNGSDGAGDRGDAPFVWSRRDPGGPGRSGLPGPAPAMTPSDTLPDPRALAREAYGASWQQCDQLSVPALHRLGLSGRGVLVCILDGGFRLDHEAFATTHVIATRDFVEHDATVGYDPDRPAGVYNTPGMEYHGTYTLSTLGGFANGAVIGPAYRAEFAVGRTEVVESETRMEEDAYVAGLEWADSLGADVVSTSLGYLDFDSGFAYWPTELDGRTAVTTRAAAALARRGVVLVAAVGNEGPDPGSLLTPADAESVVSVGAVNPRGEVAHFSSRGPNAAGVIKPDVCARGVGTACATASAPDAYAAVNGTSLATPLIGGLAALLLEAHPAWTPWQVQQALHAAGDQSLHPDNDRGWGVPDGLAAIGFFNAADPDSPQLTVRSLSWVESVDPERPSFQDTLASPGDRGRLRIVLANEGAEATRSAWLSLALAPEGIEVGVDSVFVAGVEPGQSITVTTGPMLAIATDHPVPQLDRLPLRLRTDRGVYFRSLELAVVAPLIQVRPYPNPLLGNEELTLDLDQAAPGPVTLSVFDAAGRMIAQPYRAVPLPQRTRLHWTPGGNVAAGVYFLRVEAAGAAGTRRFVLIR